MTALADAGAAIDAALAAAAHERLGPLTRKLRYYLAVPEIATLLPSVVGETTLGLT
jgi:hypothetical protein